MNVERLKQVRDLLVEKGEQQFGYYSYFDKCVIVESIAEIGQRVNQLHTCGTTACIAGWTCSLIPEQQLRYYTSLPLPYANAMRWLDLTDKQADYLFLGHTYKDEPILHLASSKLEDALRRIDFLINEPT